jgi:ATP-dependent Lhr-like helicase
MRVAEHLAQHGACFFDEIALGTRLLPVEIEEALTELVAKGRARCDSYAGLRALLVPASKRASADTRRRRRMPLFGIEDAGRWTLVRPPAAAEAMVASSAEAIEQVVHVLLRRYGVICWRLLEREAAWLPPWRDLVRVCRRLEARGEIRGGRFIAGVSGEQFALPEAVASMRQVRRHPGDGALVALAASDPANLLGTIVNGPKVPRVAGSRVLYRDGVPIATSVAGEIAMLVSLDAAQTQAARRALSLEPQLRTFELAAQTSA